MGHQDHHREKYRERRVSQYYGENTFSFALMREKLPKPVYAQLEQAMAEYHGLPAEAAEAVAAAIRDWALAKGASAYTHWFQPLTGLTAEKHDSFIVPDGSGGALENFSGAILVKSEPDASSFPHGGMRSTFEARGYAAWDPSSPAFILDGPCGRTLYLPSVFVSYDGQVLDKKAPLIKSIRALSQQCSRLLGLLGHGTDWVRPTVGPEQEYFLVDWEHFQARPDLRILGYTIFGEKSPKGQQFGDHYFGAIRDRVLGFMQELEIELFRLGVPAKTRHNEVAPNQFELACYHEPANLAADHNQLVMELLRRVARRHRLAALLHEKPFSLVNGSGKHNNWSLQDSAGNNLLDPGSSRKENIRFLCLVVALLDGIREYGDVLRAIIADPGNDLRLGSHEAPPAVMSVFLGDQISQVLSRLEQGSLGALGSPSTFSTGVPFIPHFPKDATDRNRTSPIAFTGNKFEFRAIGSSASIAMPNTVINTIMAEGVRRLSELVEAKLAGGAGLEQAALEAIRETYARAKAAHYEGDNYSREWLAEAESRGLAIARDTPEALEFLERAKNVELFARHGVMTAGELEARHRVKRDVYVKTVELELRTARNMLRTLFLPAGFHYQAELAESIRAAESGFQPGTVLKGQREYLKKVSLRMEDIIRQLAELDSQNEELKHMDPVQAAGFCARSVRPSLHAVREVVDDLEERVDAGLWPIPRYWQMLSGL
jgi:glutamine synthetase